MSHAAADPAGSGEDWQRLEAENTLQRTQNCRAALARLLGGDPLDAEEPFPRIGVCLGGASNWDTPLSCVAFLDGLSAPLHACSTQTGTNGVKLIDTVSTVSCSGTASWVCAALMDTMVTNDTAADGPSEAVGAASGAEPMKTPFHGTSTDKSQANSWYDWETAHAAAREGETSASLRRATRPGGSPGTVPTAEASTTKVTAVPLVQPRNPWCFGPTHYFREDVHTYNGLVEIFSRSHLTEASQMGRVKPSHRLFTAAAVGNGLIIPSVLLNPALGGSTVARWTNFLRRAWLPCAQAEVSTLPSHPAPSPPLLGPAMAHALASGQLPFVVFAALDVQLPHTLRAMVPSGDVARSWCGPELRWMELTALYVRSTTPLCRADTPDGSETRPAWTRAGAVRTVCHDDEATRLRVDVDGADEVPCLADNLETLVDVGLETRQSAESSATTSPMVADRATSLCLDHVMALCASALPLTTVEQECAYLERRAERVQGSSLLSDDEDAQSAANSLRAEYVDACSPNEQEANLAVILEEDLTSPPPSPRLLSSAVEGSSARLPWAAVPLYVQRRVTTTTTTESPSSTRQILSSAAPSRRTDRPPEDSTTTAARDSHTSSASVRTVADAPMELFAMCRDPTASFRAPLPSLLEASGGRQFDIVIVHDTAPSATYARLPESLARAVELGFYKLDDRFGGADENMAVSLLRRPSSTSLPAPASVSAPPSASSSAFASSLSRPYGAQEVVRVFRGAPGYPTILYFFGLPGRRCFESALDADTLRRACHEVRTLVMEHVTPLLIHEARRWRYQQRTHFTRLTPLQERTLRVVPTRFAAVGVPKLARSRTAMEEVWAQVCRVDAVHRSSSMPFRARQTVVDYTGIETVCAFELELKGVRNQLSTLEFYEASTAVFFDQLPLKPRACMMGRLQASALHYLSAGGEAHAWQPLRHFLPTMNADARRVMRMSLQFNVFQWRMADAAHAPPRTFLDSVRDTRPRDARDGSHGEIEVSLRPFSAVFFALGALLGVLCPQDPRLGSVQGMQVGSVRDFYRIEWLRSNQSVALIYMVCLGSLYLGVWEEAVEILCDAFASQICAFWDAVQERARVQLQHAQPLTRPHRPRSEPAQTPYRPPVVALSEDRIAKSSAPIPTRAPSRTDPSSRAAPEDSHGPAYGGTPPSVTAYATATVAEPPAVLSVRTFSTALALTLEFLFEQSTAGGEEKVTQFLDRLEAYMAQQSRSGSWGPGVTIAAPASFTLGCTISYGELFFTALLVAVAQSTYDVAFFKTVYAFGLRAYAPTKERATNGVAMFFWTHTLEAVCDNANAAVRLAGQAFLLDRVGADVDAFAAQVAAAQRPGASYSADEVADAYDNLWAGISPTGAPSAGFKALREAYAYALPNVLSLLVPRAPNDVGGFLSILSVTPSLLSDPETQRHRVHQCAHLFLARGWTDWRFFRFMVRTLVAHGVRMPYLTPAVYQIVIPCYLERPLECAAVLRYAAQCPQLESIEFATGPRVRAPTAGAATAVAVAAVTSPAKGLVLPSLPSQLIKKDARSSIGVPSTPATAAAASSRVLRVRQRTSAEQAAADEAVVASLTHTVPACTKVRAAAEEVRRALPADLQALLDTALRCAESSRANIDQRPSARVDSAIGAIVRTLQF